MRRLAATLTGTLLLPEPVTRDSSVVLSWISSSAATVVEGLAVAAAAATAEAVAAEAVAAEAGSRLTDTALTKV